MLKREFKKTKDFFQKQYELTGSTRELAKKFSKTQGWALYWLKN